MPGEQRETINSGPYQGGVILSYPIKNIYMRQEYSMFPMAISKIKYLFDANSRFIKVLLLPNPVFNE